jgi:catechol 2,3-dioxygenase-like lactoylglutathione lyase family enzyme
VDDARRFYGDLVGLAELEKPPLLAARGGVWFRLGAQQLHVGISDRFVPAVKAHPALRDASVRELERLARRLEEGGCPVRWAERREVPGARRFFVDDPWGNRVELIARGR